MPIKRNLPCLIGGMLLTSYASSTLADTKPASIIEQIPANFRLFAKNKDDVYVACSKTFAESLGKTVPQIVGHTDYQITNKADAQKYRKDDRDVMQSGKAKLNYVENALGRDGKQVKVITSKTPWRDNTGKIIGVIGVSYKMSGPR